MDRLETRMCEDPRAIVLRRIRFALILWMSDVVTRRRGSPRSQSPYVLLCKSLASTRKCEAQALQGIRYNELACPTWCSRSTEFARTMYAITIFSNPRFGGFYGGMETSVRCFYRYQQGGVGCYGDQTLHTTGEVAMRRRRNKVPRCSVPDLIQESNGRSQDDHNVMVVH
ncbi:hypothetical protein SCP_1700310 [Sparassis crispa]|uniref:Uncharacterized protein n=1 Tax=Sparassis crispa TaxID=139825 RepID=A0A401H5I5_9APHY|nr:hypothetical protein SCP_1700310 [Sparassis crispa]GBE89707.1 hypothetical protein SCP_1700310 [Sparassis crispa]